MNPWEIIDLDDYENHMKLDTVKQLQILNQIMKGQIDSYNTRSICILGVSGGNGLEHIESDRVEKVYGIDINKKYLEQCKERYDYLSGVLKLVHADMTDIENAHLPDVDLLIANLLIEYIGIDVFTKQVCKTHPKYISVVIQVDGKEKFVSHSPYQEKLHCLNSIHHTIKEEDLTQKLRAIDYDLIYQESFHLPNDKSFLRLDYQLVI